MLVMVKRLICKSLDCKRGPDGKRAEFTPRVRTQEFCSRTCSNRENQRTWIKRHKKDRPPPGKPPGRARFSRPKLNPGEAVLNFPAPPEDRPGSKQARVA